MTAIFVVLDMLLQFAFWVILIQVIMSWLITFNVVNVRQPFVYQVWTGINRLTEPVYRPIRRMLPDLGGLDLAPMLVIIAIYFLRILLRHDIAPALGVIY